MTVMAVEISGLKKSFGKHTVLNNVNLVVPAGTVFALLGPNGAGKTTIIRILTTLIAPDEGRIRVAGHDPVSHAKDVKKSVSLTGQFAAVDGLLTAAENLRMIGRLSGLSAADARRRADELLRQFDLLDAARKPVGTFSGGMRRRLDLALSLVVNRPVLFLDEPTTGLDTRSRRQLWNMIENLANDGMTIFLTTQYLEEADVLADRIGVISGGRIVAEGTPKELKANLGREAIEVRSDRDELLCSVPTDGSIGDLARIAADLAGRYPSDSRFRISSPSMDDVFLTLTDKPTEVPAK